MSRRIQGTRRGIRHHFHRIKRHVLKPRVVISSLILLLLLGYVWYKRENPQAAPPIPVKTYYSRGGNAGAARDRILLKFRTSATATVKNNVLKKYSLTRKSAIGKTGVEILSVPSGSSPATLADRIRKGEKASVLFAETDALIVPSDVPNDQLFSSQWHLHTIQAPDAWTRTKAVGVVLGICDTGVDAAQPDLASTLLGSLGYNTVDNTANWSPVDGHPHGTLVSGTVAAATNNALGVAGVAWGAKIIPVRISNFSNGGAYYSDAAECIAYAADNGARAINLSYRMADSSTIDAAALYAESKGAVTVVAAGNDGMNLSWPDFPTFLAVSATTQGDMLASFSSYGTYVDIAAPGVSILTTTTGTGYSYASGTSLAAPVVTGTLGLIFGAKPTLSATDAKRFLTLYADDLGIPGEDPQFGSGRVNASRTIAAVTGNAPLPTPSVTVTPSPTPVPTTTPVPTPTQAPQPTPTPVPDSIPPSPPTEMTATPELSGDCCAVVLFFRGSTDNVGVVKYDIYVNGAYNTTITSAGNTPGIGYTYNQFRGAPLTTYSFYVKAVDAAGNASGPSNTATATTYGHKITVTGMELSLKSNKHIGNQITVRVSVADGANLPVPEATVTLAVTAPSGQHVSASVATETKGRMTGTSEFRFTVTETGIYTATVMNVSKSGYTYVPGVNDKTIQVP